MLYEKVTVRMRSALRVGLLAALLLGPPALGGGVAAQEGQPGSVARHGVRLGNGVTLPLFRGSVLPLPSLQLGWVSLFHMPKGMGLEIGGNLATSGLGASFVPLHALLNLELPILWRISYEWTHFPRAYLAVGICPKLLLVGAYADLYILSFPPIVQDVGLMGRVWRQGEGISPYVAPNYYTLGYNLGIPFRWGFSLTRAPVDVSIYLHPTIFPFSQGTLSDRRMEVGFNVIVWFWGR